METHSSTEIVTLDWAEIFQLLIRIIDTQGEGLSNATVTGLRKGGLEFSEETNSTGYITSQTLPVDIYTISSSKDGYQGKQTIYNHTGDYTLTVIMKSAYSSIILFLLLGGLGAVLLKGVK